MVFLNKNKTVQIAGIFISILIVLIIFNMYIRTPLIKEIKKIIKDIDQLNQEIAIKQPKAQKQPELENEFKALHSILSDSLHYYIYENKLSSAVASIVDEQLIGKDITIVDYKPQNIEEYNSLFKRQAFNLKIIANYQALLHYITLLLNNYNAISFKTIEISPCDETGNLLHIAIDGYVYAIKESELKNVIEITGTYPPLRPCVQIAYPDTGIPNIFFNLFIKSSDTTDSDSLRERKLKEYQRYVEKISSLKIQGIWIGKEKKVIIDNNIYSEGDYFNTLRISEITSKQVIFEYNGTRIIKMLSELP
ncbi:MAG: hypothetical protein AB1765_04145 [Candidatus Hydrogenedentota bacterium]